MNIKTVDIIGPKFLFIFLLQDNQQEKVIRTQRKKQKHNKTKPNNNLHLLSLRLERFLVIN